MSSLATTVIGVVGTVTTVGMFGAPAKHFRQIVRLGDVGQWSANPYIVGLFQCLLWVVYDAISGYLMHGIANSIGVLLQAVFCLLFLLNARGQRVRVALKIAAAGALTAATAAVVLLCAGGWAFLGGAPEQRAKGLLGYICMVLCILMFAAPLDVAWKVVCRRAAVEDCLPWLLSVNILLNLSLWLTYGALNSDPIVWVPCVAGIFLAVVQLVLYASYRGCPLAPCKAGAGVGSASPRPAADLEAWPREEATAGGEEAVGSEAVRLEMEGAAKPGVADPGKTGAAARASPSSRTTCQTWFRTCKAFI